MTLVLVACSVPAFADSSKTSEPAAPPEAKAASEKATKKPNPQLKKDMERLLADARAGKVAPRPQLFPPTSRNNLSKTAKIVIISSAIGATIFLAIMFHQLSKD
jgi:hypothetical protein